MKKLNILDYKKVGDKMACAFSDECKLREVDDDKEVPLTFEYKGKDGKRVKFCTTIDGKYDINDTKSVIYPRAGVYTWDNEPKLVNHDNLEVLSIISESETIMITIENSKERIFTLCRFGKRT